MMSGTKKLFLAVLAVSILGFLSLWGSFGISASRHETGSAPASGSLRGHERIHVPKPAELGVVLPGRPVTILAPAAPEAAHLSAQKQSSQGSFSQNTRGESAQSPAGASAGGSRRGFNAPPEEVRKIQKQGGVIY